MKKLSPSEVEGLELSIVGRRPNRHIEILREMEVGEYYLLSADEWTLKTEPSTYIGGYFRSARSEKRFSTRKTRDGRSYLITRLPDRRFKKGPKRR